MRKEYVIITAGGIGTRMDSGIPKQFKELNGLPVIMHSIKAFSDYSHAIKLIIVLPSGHMDKWNSIIEKFPLSLDYKVCAGGETRFESVKNGLDLTEGDGLVAIHDAVRPLVSISLISQCFLAAAEHGNAIPVMPLADSVREISGKESRPADREKIRLVQTPQVFDVALIKKAYVQAYRTSFTDDASVVEAFGSKIFLVEGEKKNIKITTAEDVIIANAYLKE
jgi:2-C-methyl-D-erythritol 4-phosphate cytidylyltransferase